MGKESTCNAEDTGDVGSVPGWGRFPGGGHGNSLQYSCLENPMDNRSLAGYSPWNCKEPDMTESIEDACRLLRTSRNESIFDISFNSHRHWHMGRIQNILLNKSVR